MDSNLRWNDGVPSVMPDLFWHPLLGLPLHSGVMDSNLRWNDGVPSVMPDLFWHPLFGVPLHSGDMDSSLRWNDGTSSVMLNLVQHPLSGIWIPAFVGMTTHFRHAEFSSASILRSLDSSLRWNDDVPAVMLNLVQYPYTELWIPAYVGMTE